MLWSAVAIASASGNLFKQEGLHDKNLSHILNSIAKVKSHSSLTSGTNLLIKVLSTPGLSQKAEGLSVLKLHLIP